jgi:hypothetical protein
MVSDEATVEFFKSIGWPPNSQNSLDYYVWNGLKQLVY